MKTNYDLSGQITLIILVANKYYYKILKHLQTVHHCIQLLCLYYFAKI